MNPTWIEARNFRSWSQLGLRIPDGCTAVIGENGAGKSSLLALIEAALFGGRWDRLLKRGESEMEILLQFEHAGSMYRVRRHFSARGRGKSATDFEQRDEQTKDWRAVGGGRQADTQAGIEALLGVSQETWNASAYLRQGNAAAFTDAKPAERKEILADVLGLGVYERLMECATRDLKAAADDMARLHGEFQAAEAVAMLIEPTQEALQNLAAITDDHANGIRKLEQELEQATESKQRRVLLEAELADAKRLDVIARDSMAAATQRRDQMQERLSRAEAENARLGDLQVERQALPQIEAERVAFAERQATYQARRADMQGKRQALSVLEREVERAEQRIEQLRADLTDVGRKLEAHGKDGICSVCGQQLQTADAKQRALRGLEQQAAAIQEQQADAKGRREIATEALQAARDALREFGEETPPEWTPYQQRALEQAQKAEQAYWSAMGQAQRLSELRQDVETAKQHERQAHQMVCQSMDRLKELTDALGAMVWDREPLQIQADLARAIRVREERAAQRGALEEQLRRAIEAAGMMELFASQMEANAEERTLCGSLRAAYSRNGIPALIVETSAIPMIELEANRILEALGTSYRVELRSQRALKSGDGLRETLDIVVGSPTGEAVYEDFSGGEKTKLNLALRIALARILANRRGADIRLLAIDEPEFLDEASVARLAEVLHGLSADFDRVLLVSHVPTLREAFDQVIEVRADEDGSVVV